jgi:integrase
MPDKLIKPYPQFPLTPHSKGYWVKVINGKQHRFGRRWCEPDEALAAYIHSKSDIEAGREVELQPDDMTLREGLLLFLRSRKRRLEQGDIVKRSYDDYEKECQLLRDKLGAKTPLKTIGPRHFVALRESMVGSPNTISNRIGRVRVVFKYLFECGALDVPVRYGPDFSKPSQKTLRLHKASKDKKLYTPAQIHLLLGKAPPQLKAMIYLGLFCGFGNNDCGRVQAEHLDLEKGWVTYHRPKTGISRRAWIPQEAINALKAVSPSEGRVFTTRRGNAWSTEKKKNPIAVEFKKLAAPLGCNLGFYALRHTCETVGGGCKDQVAMDHIMGHVSNGMAATYREEIEDSRLKTIGQFINAWLNVDPLIVNDDTGLATGD